VPDRESRAAVDDQPAAPQAGVERAPVGWLIRLLPSLGPGLIMLCIGLYRADRPVLSWDEVSTADVARRSAGQIWQLMQNIDAVIGPYYLLVHFWTRIVGDSEVALRFPSIVAMAAAVGVAAELGRQLFTPLIGGVTGLVLCIMPNTSRYAAEARPYAIACLTSVLALLLLHRALDRRTAPGWVAYAIAVVLLGCSHIVALTVLGAHAAAVGFRAHRDRSWRVAAVWSAVAGASLAVLAPLALLGARQQDGQVSWVPPLTRHLLLTSPSSIVGSVYVAWLLIGLVLLVGWRPLRPVVEVAMLAVAPLGVVALVSVLGSPLWVARYLLVVLAPLAMLAAVAAVGRGPRTWATTLRLGAILLVLACVALPAQRSVRGVTAKNGADYRAMGRLIEQQQQPGDGLVYEGRSRTLRAGLTYYLRDDPQAPVDILRLRTAAEANGLRAEEVRNPRDHAATATRLWLVVTGSSDDPVDRKRTLRPLLDASYDRVGLWHFRWATLGLYQRRTTAPDR
jgi:mannosyltransferase